MEVITIETRTFKELEAKIDAIADFVANSLTADNINEDDIWMDSYKVAHF